MDSAFWYGLNRSQAGRHARQLGEWQEALYGWKDRAEEAEVEAEELERELKSAAHSRDNYKIANEVLNKHYAKLKADHAAYVAKVNDGWNLLVDQWRVERAQKVFFKTFFDLLLEYVPGLREDMMRGGHGIPNEVHRVYGETLRAQGITPEKLDRLHSNGYGGFIEPPPSFADPALAAPTEEQHATKPGKTFVSTDTVKLRDKVEDLRTKYNKLVADHNDLADNRFLWIYQAALSQAEAEGHKAVLDLYRNPPPNAGIDAPNSDIPAPEGQCDSLSSAAFRRAFATYLIEQEALKEDLARFAVEAQYEFPFPMVEYMDWIATQSQDDVPAEGQEGPQGLR